MATAQELFEDARMQGEEDAMDGESRKTKRDLGKTYGSFDLSDADFDWLVRHYRRGYDEMAGR